MRTGVGKTRCLVGSDDALMARVDQASAPSVHRRNQTHGPAPRGAPAAWYVTALRPRSRPRRTSSRRKRTMAVRSGVRSSAAKHRTGGSWHGNRAPRPSLRPRSHARTRAEAHGTAPAAASPAHPWPRLRCPRASGRLPPVHQSRHCFQRRRRAALLATLARLQPAQDSMNQVAPRRITPPAHRSLKKSRRRILRAPWSCFKPCLPLRRKRQAHAQSVSAPRRTGCGRSRRTRTDGFLA